MHLTQVPGIFFSLGCDSTGEIFFVAALLGGVATCLVCFVRNDTRKYLQIYLLLLVINGIT